MDSQSNDPMCQCGHELSWHNNADYCSRCFNGDGAGYCREFNEVDEEDVLDG